MAPELQRPALSLPISRAAEVAAAQSSQSRGRGAGTRQGGRAEKAGRGKGCARGDGDDHRELGREGRSIAAGAGSHQRSSEMRLWILPQSPATPCFPFAPFPLALPLVAVSGSTHAPLRMQFQQAASCAEPGGCRDTALRSRPTAPVHSHAVAGSIAAAPSCGLSACHSLPLSFSVKLRFCTCSSHICGVPYY